MINLDDSINTILNRRNSRQVSTDFGLGFDLDKHVYDKSKAKVEIKYNSPAQLADEWTRRLFKNKEYNKNTNLQSKYLYSKLNLPLIKEVELTYLTLCNQKESLNSIKVTCIHSTQNYIILGYSSGKTTIFLQSTRPLQEFKPIKQEDPVISLETNPSESLLLISHFSGCIFLFDLNKLKLMASFQFHYSPVTSIKFLTGSSTTSNSKVLFFSADSSGKCYLSQIEKQGVKGDVSSFPLSSGEIGPISGLHVFEKGRDFGSKFSVLIAVCGVKRIAVFAIEPKIELVFAVEREEILRQEMCPSCVWVVYYSKLFLAIAWESCLFVYEFDESHPENFIEIVNTDLECDLAKVLIAEGKALIIFSKQEIFCFKIEKILNAKNKILRKIRVKAVSFQEVIKVNSINRPTYDNMISICDKGIFFISKNSIIKVAYLNWEGCVDELANKRNWIVCIAIAIQFFKGKYQKVYVVEDKTSVIKKITEIIQVYIADENVNIRYRIRNSVEICVLTGDFDKMNVEIYERLMTEGKEQALEVFIESFEYFVLTGQIKSLSIVIIAKMADYYKDRGKLYIFESILVHLDPLFQNYKILLKICKDYNLSSGYAFIFSKTSEGDYKEPLKLMTTLMKNADDITNKYLEYYKLVNFIEKLLRKQLIDGSYINDEKFFLAIEPILKFVSKSKNLSLLFEIDPASTLNIFYNIYTNKVIKNLIDNSKSSILNPKDFSIHLLELFQESCAYFLSIALFIITICSVYGQILENSVLCSLIKYALSKVINNNQILAYDLYHYISQISSNINKPLFGSYELHNVDKIIAKTIKKSEFTQEQIDEFYKLSSFLPYSRLIILISEMRKDYENCIYTFIRSPNPETRIKVFKWIRKVYNSLEAPQQFLTIIEKNLEDLGILDPENTFALILDYYNSKLTELINIVKRAENLQLLMLEKIKKKGLSTNFIETYVNLLCKLQPSQVLLYLKSLPSSTPIKIIEACVNICKQLKSIDEVCYLLSINNKIFEALEIIYIELRKKIKIFSESKIYISQFESVSQYIFKIYELCEGNLDDLEPTEAKGIFTSILHLMIEFHDKLNGEFEIQYQELMKMIVTSALHYVNFEFLLQKTTEKTGKVTMSIFKEALFELFSKRSFYHKNLKMFSKILNKEVESKTEKQYHVYQRGINIQSICWKCMSSLQNKKKVKVFQCGHGFHKLCIESNICLKCSNKVINKKLLYLERNLTN